MTNKQRVFSDIIMGLLCGVLIYYEIYIYIFLLAVAIAASWYLISGVNICREYGSMPDNSGEKKEFRGNIFITRLVVVNASALFFLLLLSSFFG